MVTLTLAALINGDVMNFHKILGLIVCLTGISLHIALKACSKYIVSGFAVRCFKCISLSIGCISISQAIKPILGGIRRSVVAHWTAGKQLER